MASGLSRLLQALALYYGFFLLVNLVEVVFFCPSVLYEEV